MKTFGLDLESLAAIYSKLSGCDFVINASIDRARQTVGYPIAYLEALEFNKLISEMKLEDISSRIAIEQSIQYEQDVFRSSGHKTLVTPPLCSQNFIPTYGLENEILMLEYSRSSIYKSLHRVAENIKLAGDKLGRPLLSQELSLPEQQAATQAGLIVLDKNRRFANKQIARIDLIRKRLVVFYGRLSERSSCHETVRSIEEQRLRKGHDIKHGTSGFLRKHRTKKPQHNPAFSHAM